MSTFDREVKNLYSRHRHSAKILEQDKSNIEFKSIELAMSRTPVTDNEYHSFSRPEEIMSKLQASYAHRDTAVATYNKIIDRAAKHKDDYLEFYDHMAKNDVLRHAE